MPIEYALVGYGKRVLAEGMLNPGNHTVIARRILEKIPKRAHKKSYSYEGHVFHYLAEDDGLVVLCMADANTGHRISFACLGDIKNRFVASYGDSYQMAPELEYNETFSRTILEKMDYYSNDPNADKIRKVRGEIDQVKTVMIENIDKVLERGDKIETLMDKTDLLQAQSQRFRTVSTSLKRHLWWKNTKLCCCVIIVAMFLLMLFITFFMWFFNLGGL